MPPTKTKGAWKREFESASSDHEHDAEMAPEEEDDDSDEERPNRSQRTPLKSKLEEIIADFYEANPLFYDKGNPDYKNKDKKRALMENLCKTLGIGIKPQDITRKFKSHRTEYVKLKRMKKSLSGSGRASLTSLQRWKLGRYQFLDPYCITRQPEDPGWVQSTATIDAEDEEEEVKEVYLGDVEEVAGTSTGEATAYGFSRTSTEGATPYGSPGTSTDWATLYDSSTIGSERGEKRSRTGDPKAKKKKGPNTGSLADILTKFLQDSDKDKKRAQKEVKTTANEAQQPLDERVAWGQWLMSTCLRVPSAHFRQYQRDTFEAALRWMPRDPVDQGRPLPGPSVLPPPQGHTPHQQVFAPHIPVQPQQQPAQQIQQPGVIQGLGGYQQQHQQQQQQQPVMGWIPTALQATPAVLTTMSDPTPVTRPSSVPSPSIDQGPNS